MNFYLILGIVRFVSCNLFSTIVSRVRFVAVVGVQSQFFIVNAKQNARHRRSRKKNRWNSFVFVCGNRGVGVFTTQNYCLFVCLFCVCPNGMKCHPNKFKQQINKNKSVANLLCASTDRRQCIFVCVRLLFSQNLQTADLSVYRKKWSENVTITTTNKGRMLRWHFATTITRQPNKPNIVEFHLCRAYRVVYLIRESATILCVQFIYSYISIASIFNFN